MFASKTHPFSLGGAVLAAALMVGLAAYDAPDASGGRRHAARSYTPVTYCCYQYRPVVIKRTIRRYYTVPSTSTVITSSVPHHHHDGSHHHDSHHHGSVQKVFRVDDHGHPIGYAPVEHSHQKPAIDGSDESPFPQPAEMPAAAETADEVPMNAPALEPPASE